ncbi:DUF3667 domain-containing protein [Aquimarina litoralis]|uniref:DUF3667 domain-containing protein n=1 Tax=Aquimarina litoralis TaxID=584605 RepID=UPI001C58A2E9|nr:DUF3667 domain-containing protein [Aquimarina litoralis]MBW1293961.1 DUF3667 domain-containing protein [Aquimarina litoralis]
MRKCLNCGTEYKGNFCPECGQKGTVDKITLSFLVNDFLSRFMDIDKGILFNIKHLTLYPQKTIFNYLLGKRKNVLNPVSYALIATSLYLLISSQFELNWINTTNLEKYKGEIYDNSYEAGKIIGTYTKFFWLLNILFLSVFSRLFFKKFSFLEHLAMNCFIHGHATILGILTFIPFRLPVVYDPFVFLYIIILNFMIFQKKGDRFEIAVAAFFSVFFSYLLFYTIPFIIVFITK